MNKLILLPAVDVSNGQAVRLVQGELGSETIYGSPLDAALNFQEQGAEWIHLVDLDAAFGKGNNYSLLKDVVEKLEINVELSGGIRDDESLDNALSTGAKRINLGTAALENPEWTKKVIKLHGDKIAIGLDVRGRTLAARGWTKDGGDLFETLKRYVEVANSGKYKSWEEINAKFPELSSYDIEVLKEYVATANSGKYKSWEEINSKFPEFKDH